MNLILLGSAESVVAVVWSYLSSFISHLRLLFSELEVSHSPTFTLELCFQYLG